MSILYATTNRFSKFKSFLSTDHCLQSCEVESDNLTHLKCNHNNVRPSFVMIKLNIQAGSVKVMVRLA